MSQISSNDIEKKLSNAKPINEHFYSVLSKTSAFGEFLCYTYKPQINNYVERDTELTFISKNNDVDANIEDHEYPISTQVIVDEDELDIKVMQPRLMYDDEASLKMKDKLQVQLSEGKGIIEIDLSFLEGPNPSGENYIDVLQRSAEWHSTRKHRITGSRIAALLGFDGKNKYDDMWNVVRYDVVEKGLTHLQNIQRGLHYEQEALP